MQNPKAECIFEVWLSEFNFSFFFYLLDAYSQLHHSFVFHWIGFKFVLNIQATWRERLYVSNFFYPNEELVCLNLFSLSKKLWFYVVLKFQRSSSLGLRNHLMLFIWLMQPTAIMINKDKDFAKLPSCLFFFSSNFNRIQWKMTDWWSWKYVYKESQKCWNLAQRDKLKNIWTQKVFREQL